MAQALLAALTLTLLLAIEDSLSNAAILSAVASTAFVVFITPMSVMATPRRVIGGHLVAVIVGLTAGVLLRDTLLGAESPLARDTIAAFAVGAGMLVMAATETEHPPAAGTVLGLLMGAHPAASGALVLASAVALSSVRALLARWLVDLT